MAATSSRDPKGSCRSRTIIGFAIPGLAIVSLAFVAGIIVLANRGELPAPIRALYDFPHGDKVGHVALFGALTGAIALATRRPRITGAVVAGCVAVEELSQQWFSTRTFDLVDLAATFLGIALAVMIVEALVRRSEDLVADFHHD